MGNLSKRKIPYKNLRANIYIKKEREAGYGGKETG